MRRDIWKIPAIAAYRRGVQLGSRYYSNRREPGGTRIAARISPRESRIGTSLR